MQKHNPKRLYREEQSQKMKYATNMEYVIEHNNAGVKHICDGRVKEAKKAFKAALVRLAVFHERQRDDEDAIISCDCNQESACDSPIKIETCCLPDSSSPCSPSHVFYMYRNALIVHFDLKSQCDATTEVKMAFCLAAVISFNLTLTLHYKLEMINESGDSGQEEVKNRRVLLFYKKVWKALQIDTQVSPMHQSYRDIMSSAVMNNMGIIFCVLTKFQKARYCFESLKRVSPDFVKGVTTNLCLLEDHLNIKLLSTLVI
mmetsp:Transcript_27252/g.41215  ORF Transcript_27252/g.41215 Transcript_27252/m.41215 type:complete len:259 (+) Transcript_27252:186-962(+)